jgi:hypothetical protein
VKQVVGSNTEPHGATFLTTAVRTTDLKYNSVYVKIDRLCGLVVRVLGYRSEGPGSVPGTTRKKK